MAERDAVAVLRLVYDAFPFEVEGDREELPKGVNPEVAMRFLVRNWRTERMPQLVAIDQKGNVIGVASIRPLTTEDGRASTSVCTLARVVVHEGRRGEGIGEALIEHAVEAAAELNFGSVMASIPSTLQRWYERLGWKVAAAGDVYSFIEHPHPGDDELLGPSIAPPANLRDQFAPVQSQEPGPPEHGYDRIAHRAINSESNLILTWTWPPDELLPSRGLWRLLVQDPDLARALPKMTVAVLVGEMGQSAGQFQVLKVMQMAGIA